MPAKQSTDERFFNKIATSNLDDCWHWVGSQNSSGYGHISNGTSRILAHRFSYGLYRGEVPKDLLVRHTCDNPLCVNPEHLVLGTYKDNAQDREKRGRNGVPIGENHRMATLSNRDVSCMRWLYSLGVSQASLAKLYHVSKYTIWSIVHNRIWKSVK